MSFLQKGAHVSKLVSPDCFEEHFAPFGTSAAGTGGGGGGGGGAAAGGAFFFFFNDEGIGAGTGVGIGVGAGAAGVSISDFFFLVDAAGTVARVCAAAGLASCGKRGSVGGVSVPPQ